MSTDHLPTGAETIEEHGGSVIIEGKWDHNTSVVVGFPSVEDARAWYENSAYEEVKPIRFEASKYADAVLIPGFSPDGLPG